MKDTVFYFGFSLYDEETEDEDYLNKGFVIKDYEFSLDEDAGGDIEQQWLDDIDKFESLYGVHDWITAPDDRVDAIGFCTYEVEKDKINELMEGWRQHFISKGFEVTKVVQYTPDRDHDSDYDIYQKVLFSK